MSDSVKKGLTPAKNVSGKTKPMAIQVDGKWVAAPGYRRVGTTGFKFERIEEPRTIEVVGDAAASARYAGREPPAGARRGRPWFCPEPGVLVCEFGWRWQDGASQAPQRPSGEEPLTELTAELRSLQRSYRPAKDSPWDDYS